jgi:DpnII restriction endonuclease
MARAKSERARSKTLAIDDLTQSIEQLQAFIPKLEDLGREGFPYLEGALTRTELQLRECIKRAFGEKSTEFQTYRHVKLSISSAAEKKQTLAFIRSLTTSLEEKKLELQGFKPAVAHKPEASPSPPPMTLVPSAVSTSSMSVTTTSTTSRPAGATMHLVSSVEKTFPPEPHAAAPTATGLSTSPAAEPTPPPMTSPSSAGAPLRAMPPRTPIEPISSLFRTQETKPVLPVTEHAPAAAASSSLRETTAVPFPTLTVPVQSPPPPPAAMAAPDPAPLTPQAAQGTFSKTEEISAPSSPGAAPTPAPSSPPSLNPTAADDTDYIAIMKRLCQRFHAVARQLRLRGEYRQTLNVEDEHDVQDLLHALLRQHFDDIGTDEWTPAYTDGSARTTFLLDHDRLAIIVKKTRTGLSRKDLVDQVRTDVERYRARGRCTQMLCFVYDPEGRIGNPRGLESELTTISDHFTVDVIVAPK